MKRKEPLILRFPAGISVTQERVKEIFSIPETKRLWEEMRSLPKFQKMACNLKDLENATMATILQEAIKLVIKEGKSFDEAVQEKIKSHKKELYENSN